MGADNVEVGLAGEGDLAGEHLVEADTQTVDIALAGHSPSLGLLRAHIIGGADYAACDRKARGLYVLGDAEVGEFDVACGVGHNVGRLDIAVDDPLGMGILERVCNRTSHIERVGHTELASQAEALFKRRAVHIFHYVILVEAFPADVENLDYAWVLERPQRLDFPAEALHE